uniref:Uncharacterized protein n=1 Tax=Strigamia maritima TaxID=126957 RepID=T1ITQ2_STRMM
MTKYRFERFTFSYAIAFGRFEILFKSPKIEYFSSVYTAPFTIEAWVITVIFSFIVAIDLTVTDKVFFTLFKQNPKNSTRNSKYSDSSDNFKTIMFFLICFFFYGALLQRGTLFFSKHIYPIRNIWDRLLFPYITYRQCIYRGKVMLTISTPKLRNCHDNCYQYHSLSGLLPIPIFKSYYGCN